MLNLHKTLTALAVCCIFSGCANKLEEQIIIENNDVCEVPIKSESRTVAPICEEDIQKIASLGFDTSDIKDFGDYYIVANQYCFYKTDLSAIHDNRTRSITTTQTLHLHKHKLYYKINSELGKSYNILIESGIYAWDDIDNCGLDIECGNSNNTYNDRYTVLFNINRRYNQSAPLVVCEYTSATIPYDITINMNSPLWSYVNPTTHLNTFIYLITHSIGESLGLNSNNTFDSYDRTIMADESLLSSQGDDLWCGFSGSDINQIMTLFPEVNTQFSYQWSPAVETYADGYLLNVDEVYNLTISSPATCCSTSTNSSFDFTIENIGNTNASCNIISTDFSEGQFSLSFDGGGEFLATVWIDDYIDGNVIKGLHKQTQTIYVVEDRLEFVPTSSVELNTPYIINYKYWHPATPNATIEYYARELLFNEGNELDIITNSDDNGCTVELSENGCYFITCTAKSRGELVGYKHCNITRMPMPDSIRMVRTLANNDGSAAFPPHAMVYDYQIDFPEHDVDGRVYYFIEAKTEHQYSRFCPPEPVEKLRTFQIEYLDFKSEQLAYSYDLPQMGWWMVSQEDELNFEGYLQFYTGYIYTYASGIREVEDLSPDYVPLNWRRDSNIDGHPSDIVISDSPVLSIR